MKLRIYNYIILWWDVVFTQIDLWQLRQWEKMKEMREKEVMLALSLTKHKNIEGSDMQPLEKWTDS